MKKNKYKKIFIIYMSILLYLLFLSRFRIYDMHTMLTSDTFSKWDHINLVPFSTIKNYIHNYGYFRLSDIVINLVGNIVVFMPFGYILPKFNEKVSSFFKLLRLLVVFTLSVEIAQTVLGVGVCDIDDVILNTIGGILGYLFYYINKKDEKKFLY